MLHPRAASQRDGLPKLGSVQEHLLRLVPGKNLTTGLIWTKPPIKKPPGTERNLEEYLRTLKYKLYSKDAVHLKLC